MPFLFQNGILQGVLIERRAVRVIHERDKLQKQSFAPHSQLFTQALAGRVIILGVGVDPPRALFVEQVVEKSVCGFVGVPMTLIGFVQHPARAEGIHRRRIPVGSRCLWRRVDFPDDLAVLFQHNGESVLRFFAAFAQFGFCILQRIHLHACKAVYGRFLQVFVHVCRIRFLKRAQEQPICFNPHAIISPLQRIPTKTPGFPVLCITKKPSALDTLSDRRPAGISPAIPCAAAHCPLVIYLHYIIKCCVMQLPRKKYFALKQHIQSRRQEAVVPSHVKAGSAAGCRSIPRQPSRKAHSPWEQRAGCSISSARRRRKRSYAKGNSVTRETNEKTSSAGQQEVLPAGEIFCLQQNKKVEAQNCRSREGVVKQLCYLGIDLSSIF